MGERQGVAFLCNADGQIKQWLYAGLAVPGTLDQWLGRTFVRLIAPGNRTKALSFLQDLREREQAINWEINVELQEGISTLHFAGFQVEEGVLIIATTTDDGLLDFYEELMRINNDQLNALRDAVKEREKLRHAQAQYAEALDEISRLNNDLMETQRELLRKNAELQRLNEQKNRLLGMAAHDLRNPLHVIYAFSELLMDEGDALDADLLEMVAVMRDSSAFMTRLVNDLLDVAKIESGELHLEREEVDLVELVERSVHLNRVLAGRKEIRLEFQPVPLPKLRLDPNKIAQVFNNLFSNAIKFSYPGSRVQVTLEKREGEVIVSVVDEGQGIPEEDFEKLFKPYAKASVRSTDGEGSTGLGLVIVRKIVEGHGGEIWVESEVGEGSTFHVALPIT